MPAAYPGSPPPAYPPAVAKLPKPGSPSIKPTAALMRSGRGFVFEGSGNLRSCRMIEQCTVTQDADLRRFHHEWITHLINGKTQ